MRRGDPATQVGEALDRFRDRFSPRSRTTDKTRTDRHGSNKNACG